jgi:hypothetical protein
MIEIELNGAGHVIDRLARDEQRRQTEVPDIDNLKPYLFEISVLLFPPLVTDVIHQFTTFNPDGAIPGKMLVDPLRMDPGVHTVLHGQHIGDGGVQGKAPSEIVRLKEEHGTRKSRQKRKGSTVD